MQTVGSFSFMGGVGKKLVTNKTWIWEIFLQGALVEMLLLDCSRTPWGLWNLCNFRGQWIHWIWLLYLIQDFQCRFTCWAPVDVPDGLYIVLCTSGWCSKRPLGLMFYEQQLVKYPTSNLELLWSLDLRKLQTEIGPKNYVGELMGPSTALLSLKRTLWVLAQRRTVIRSGFAYWRRSAAVWPRLVSSTGEPPILVPMRCSKVPPLSGTGGAPAMLHSAAELQSHSTEMGTADLQPSTKKHNAHIKMLI
jgi:hypothetical protein